MKMLAGAVLPAEGPEENLFLTFSSFSRLQEFPGLCLYHSTSPPSFHGFVIFSLHLSSVCFLLGHLLWDLGLAWLIHDNRIFRPLTFSK